MEPCLEHAEDYRTDLSEECTLKQDGHASQVVSCQVDDVKMTENPVNFSVDVLDFYPRGLVD